MYSLVHGLFKFINMMKKLNQQEYLSRANKFHNEKYDYSKTVYNGAFETIEIICPNHGIFIQKAYNHLRYGCQKCGAERSLIRTIKNRISFLFDSTKVIKEYDRSLIPLGNNHFAIVDTEDLHLLEGYSWYPASLKVTGCI